MAVELAAAYISLVPETSKIAPGINSAMTTAGTNAGKTFSSKFGSALKIGGTLAAAFAVTKGVTFFKDTIAEATEARKVMAATANVIRSTGGAANVSAKQVASLASAISDKVAIDDEAIQSGANLLLTFKNIRNETGAGNKIFDQATKTITDMSVALGQDMKSGAIQLGKALNDPIKGVSALSRVGVTFNEQQTKQITKLQESGNLMAAQKVILGELKTEFGGAAAAAATPAEKAAVAWGNFKEDVGTALLPVLDRLANWFVKDALPAVRTFGSFLTGDVVPAVSALAASVRNNLQPPLEVFAGFLANDVWPIVRTVFGFLRDNTAVVKAFAVVLGIAAVGFGALTVATAAWNAVLALNPIGLIVVALAALAAGLTYAYQKSETFRAIVDKAWSVIKQVISVAWKIIKPILKAYWWYLSEVVAPVVKWLWEKIVKPVFTAIMGKIQDAWKVIKPVLSALWRFIRDDVGPGAQVAVGARREARLRASSADKSVAAGCGSNVDHSGCFDVHRLGGKFLDAGKWLISQLGKGLAKVGGFVLDIGKSIVNFVIEQLELGDASINDAPGDGDSIKAVGITINPLRHARIPELAGGGRVSWRRSPSTFGEGREPATVLPGPGVARPARSGSRRGRGPTGPRRSGSMRECD